MVIVEDDDAPAWLGGADHAAQGVERGGQPVQDPRGGDDVEHRTNGQRVGVAHGKMEIGDARVRPPRRGHKSLVAVEPDGASPGRHGAGDIVGDGAGSAADIEDGHSGTEQFGQAAVRGGKGPRVKDLAGPLGHLCPAARHVARRACLHLRRVPVVVGLWGAGGDLTQSWRRLQSAGASRLVTTFATAVSEVESLLPGHETPEPAPSDSGAPVSAPPAHA